MKDYLNLNEVLKDSRKSVVKNVLVKDSEAFEYVNDENVLVKTDATKFLVDMELEVPEDEAKPNGKKVTKMVEKSLIVPNKGIRNAPSSFFNGVKAIVRWEDDPDNKKLWVRTIQFPVNDTKMLLKELLG